MRAAVIPTLVPVDVLARYVPPERFRALDWIAQHHGEFSSKMMGAALGMDVQRAAYYVRTFRDDGLLREVRQRPARGSVERFYVRKDW